MVPVRIFPFTLGCVGYVALFRVRYSHKTEHTTRGFCMLLPPEIPGLIIFCMMQRHGGFWLYERGLWGLCAYVTKPPNQGGLIVVFNTRTRTRTKMRYCYHHLPNRPR